MSADRAPAAAIASATTIEPPTSDAAAPTGPHQEQLNESLTADGQVTASGTDWAQQPEYSLWAVVEPADGTVAAIMQAKLPVGPNTEAIHLRWFPGVAAENGVVGDVIVDGEAVEVAIDESIITVALGAGHADVVSIMMTFKFVTPAFAPAPVDPMSSGDALQPADIGLLARSDDAMMLGHWFPVWIPEGLSADGDLDGYGDISNFPAATIYALLDVPEGSAVVTSGIRMDEVSTHEGRTTVTEGGIGLRDLAVVVMSDAEQVTTSAGDVDVVVTAPAGTADTALVGDLAATSVSTLADSLGAYPWAELDVVAAPLGAGAGGMEWPAMVWVESTVFAAGVPGVGDLGDIGEITDLLGEDGELGDMLGIGDIGLMIETLREWTIAHEVGHMWWHALVGNDSITEPVIDESLAQHSACLVERDLRPADAEAVCDVNTSGQFEQLQMLMGVADAAANQPSDEFDSSLQYGAVVYGKAPLFYRALENRYGVEEATAALATVVADHAFGQITTDELRSGLGTALDDPAGVDELWAHWMEEAHGAEDVAD